MEASNLFPSFLGKYCAECCFLRSFFEMIQKRLLYRQPQNIPIPAFVSSDPTHSNKSLGLTADFRQEHEGIPTS